MDKLNRVSKIFKTADQVLFDNSSRIVLMSDCHRGDGGWSDNLARNQNIYAAALNHYYKENYTYIELGDGDELWENRRLSDIIYTHADSFSLLTRFFKEGRLYFIYGNHDMVKKDDKFVRENLYQYFSQREKKYIPLFENIKVHEGLILKHRDTGDEILLIHGHQVDFINSTMWKVTRFLVRYLWKPLETFGVKDPTRTAKNYVKKYSVARKLTEWVIKEKHMLIAGHNHRPMFPEAGSPPYFNDGSCVHPRCITAIEIAGGNISLVKWMIKTREDGTLSIGRELLAGPCKIQDYFKIWKNED